MEGTPDKQRFSVVMFWIAQRMAAPGNKPKVVDTKLQRDYFEALSDIRIERIEWAAKHLFKTSTWFPMPVDLRAAAMLAPSTVFPAITLNQKALPEFTEQQHEEAAKNLDDIINGFGEWGKV
jgi:hypothetical protein